MSGGRTRTRRLSLSLSPVVWCDLVHKTKKGRDVTIILTTSWYHPSRGHPLATFHRRGVAQGMSDLRRRDSARTESLSGEVERPLLGAVPRRGSPVVPPPGGVLPCGVAGALSASARARAVMRRDSSERDAGSKEGCVGSTDAEEAIRTRAGGRTVEERRDTRGGVLGSSVSSRTTAHHRRFGPMATRSGHGRAFHWQL